MVNKILGSFFQDIRSIERETAELLTRTMRAAEGGYEPGYDIGEAGEIPAGSADVSSSFTSGGDETPSGDQPSQLQPNPKGAEEMRATFNSIEYSEAEIPNIIPKSTERMPRRWNMKLTYNWKKVLMFR